MKFAKLYEKEDSQILVLLESGEDGEPEISFRFLPEGLGVCVVKSTFESSDLGWEAAEHKFNSMTEDKANEYIREAKEIAESMA